MTTTVYLGLGSNLGDREANLRRGLELLAGRIAHLSASSVYQTEPWGYTEQPKFLNVACRGETNLPPLEVLAFCQEVERETGRTPTFRYGPRVLDIDILAYGDQAFASPELVIPHPRLAERAFVLAPLAELTPGWVHPTLGKSAAQLLREVEGREGVRVWGWAFGHQQGDEKGGFRGAKPL
ncbi:MAG: 2-amino-4-hydroxy-6-hydroxymethyldihydropteridine diphosphokinase [Chloroflexi bacterium]|nr:2-amino-4-hydroxy-6-hydroxymethyldihydropteridine diphosphokinase [Chloroflexota bacterium]